MKNHNQQLFILSFLFMNNLNSLNNIRTEFNVLSQKKKNSDINRRFVPLRKPGPLKIKLKNFCERFRLLQFSFKYMHEDQAN